MSFGHNHYVYLTIQTGAAAFSLHYARTLTKYDESLLFRQSFALFRT